MRSKFFAAVAIIAVSIHWVGAAVNPNTASVQELEALRGVGPKVAARIVADREANGPYASIGELCRVKGVSSNVLAKMLQPDEDFEAGKAREALDPEIRKTCESYSSTSGKVYQTLSLASNPQ